MSGQPRGVPSPASSGQNATCVIRGDCSAGLAPGVWHTAPAANNREEESRIAARDVVHFLAMQEDDRRGYLEVKFT